MLGPSCGNLLKIQRACHLLSQLPLSQQPQNLVQHPLTRQTALPPAHPLLSHWQMLTQHPTLLRPPASPRLLAAALRALPAALQAKAVLSQTLVA